MYHTYLCPDQPSLRNQRLPIHHNYGSTEITFFHLALMIFAPESNDCQMGAFHRVPIVREGTIVVRLQAACPDDAKEFGPSSLTKNLSHCRMQNV